LKKGLIISVGTGIGPNKNAVKSLAGAIALSIQNHNPTKTFFIVTEQSSKTLPLILPRTTCKHEVVKISNPDSIRVIYEELKPKFLEIRRKFNPVIVDFTSGTKAMTGALAILSTIFEVDTLSYVGGKRKDGKVMSGAEEIQAVRPIFMICEKRIKEATKLFNECRYDTTLSIIDSIKEMTADKSIIRSTATLRKAASAYSSWDKFDHGNAFKALKSLKAKRFSLNKRFLGKLLNANEKEPYWIADLINNAKRRGDIEHKFDDAVARLYRTTELVAQYRLRKEHKLEPSNLDPESIPNVLREKWCIARTDEKVKIALERDYELLAAKGDGVGKKFIEDKELGGLLSKRNCSILAHGLEPLTRETYQKLLGKTLDLALSLFPTLKQDMQDSSFATLPM